MFFCSIVLASLYVLYCLVSNLESLFITAIVVLRDIISGDEDGDFKLHKIGRQSSEPIMVPLWLNDHKLDMEVDTGATFSVISETTRQQIFPSETLHPSDLVLKTYTNEPMKVKGTLNMRVQHGDQKEKLVLVVVEGKGA